MANTRVVARVLIVYVPMKNQAIAIGNHEHPKVKPNPITTNKKRAYTTR